MMREFAQQLGKHSDSEEEEEDDKEEGEEDNYENNKKKSKDKEEIKEEEESNKKPKATMKSREKLVERAHKKKKLDNSDNDNDNNNNDSGEDPDGSEKSSSSDSICVKKSFIKTINKDTKICLSCGLVPCERENCKEIIKKEGLDKAKDSDGHNKAICHHLYKLYIAAKYRKLGKANCVRIPPCVEQFIRSLYPDPMENYIGFRKLIANPDQSDDKKSDCLGSSAEED